MQSAVRSSVAVLTFGAVALMTGAGPAPAGRSVQGGVSASDQLGIALGAPREVRVMIGKREHIVSVTLYRVMTLVPTDPFAAGPDVQATITIRATDGRLVEDISGATLSLRGLRTVSTNLQLSPVAANLPQAGQTWSGFFSKRVLGDAPQTTLTFTSRSRTFRVSFGSVAIQPIPTPGV